MHIPRIYIAENLQTGKKLFLPVCISKRLLAVLRLQIDEQLIVFNGFSGEYSARISEIAKQQVTLSIEEFIPRNIESPLQIHLAQGVSRGEKMDFTIQKAVELGVHSITPVFTEYCNVKLDDERLQNKLRHWQTIAIHAAEQSGRCYVTQILPAQNLKNWLPSLVDLNLVLAPEAKDTLEKITGQVKSVNLLVGPEGGFSPAEMEYILKGHFSPLKFGPRILRTETAALVAVSVLQARWGDYA